MGLKSKLWALLPVVVFVAGGVVLYGITPETTWWMPPCLFNKITGLYCPGCGTARGLHKLLHADLPGAWHMNPLMVVSIPLIGYLLARSAILGRRGAGEKARALPKWLPWTIVALVAAFWIVRNIPVYPCTLLAPH